jgi:uncharacterized protein YprB with RNaseH-like and TPR domain
MHYSGYLDIETTGLSPLSADLTVIGLHIEDGDHRVIQFVGAEICSSKLVDAIKNIKVLFTYNGARFDLPFIQKKLGIDLKSYCQHEDLMYACWKRNLYGGLKAVERTLGITRKLTDVDGWMAVQLWHDYHVNGNTGSLDTLLEYNREDVLNLKALRCKISI